MQEEPAFITIPIQTFKDILNEVQSLRDQINALESRQNEDIERLALDIALVPPKDKPTGEGQTTATTEGPGRNSPGLDSCKWREDAGKRSEAEDAP